MKMKKISTKWFEQNEHMYVKRINKTILYRFYEYLKLSLKGLEYSMHWKHSLPLEKAKGHQD